MRPLGNPFPFLRLSRTRSHLLCVVRLPLHDPGESATASELVLVASLDAPHLRRLTVFRGHRSPVLGNSPRAA